MFIADLHIHSKYSRATSKESVPEHLELWARRKGIDLVGTGDFTHPAWRQELRNKLIPAEEGFYRLADSHRIRDEFTTDENSPRFVVSGEISSIYKKNGRVRKVHNLILLPGLEAAEKLSLKLEAIGNLHSDGRPILGLDSRDLLETTLEVCPDAIFIPAHIWTPHFSLFGAFSGFDSIEECFEDLTTHIHALETGLSSDPPMNWRVSALDSYTLVSHSDAHSPAKLGREATLFDTELNYPSLYRALDGSRTGYGGTLEFFPEEGKYHLDGHRSCNLCLTPSETLQALGKCPICGKKITIGVLHRVEQLADRGEGFIPQNAAHFESIAPLPEIIAASLGLTAASVKVARQYEMILKQLGSEFSILRQLPIEDIGHTAGPLVAEGIRRMRAGQVELTPGYDGEYGKIKLLKQDEINALSGQICFASPQSKPKASKKKATAAAKQFTKKVSAEAAQQISMELPAPQNTGLLSDLNAEQRTAVTEESGIIAVIAGPGTGKTKTLVTHIAYLCKELHLDPEGMAAVTFTNKAAKEMRQRLEQMLDSSFAADQMQIGTFHSICKELLNRSGRKPVVIDEHGALSIVKEAKEKLALTSSPRKLLNAISAHKTVMQLPDVPDRFPELLACYKALLIQSQVIDYDVLLLVALHLPAETGFRFLFVDEFQDVNDLQYRLIQKWMQHGQRLFVIGDPDQSIYGFRGADFDCFSRLQKDYPTAVFIKLIENYRSSPDILEGALSAIAPNTSPDGPRALHSNQPSHGKISLITTESDFSEAIFIAKEINRLVGGIDMLDTHVSRETSQGRSFSDFAVLYRTHKQAAYLETCLRREGIPYTVSGKEAYLGEDAVRGTLSFFQWLLQPDDFFSWKTCMQTVMQTSADSLADLPIPLIRESRTPRELFSHLPAQLQTEASCQRWLAQAEKYIALLPDTQPQALLEAFIEENKLSDSPAMERLLQAARCYGKMEVLIQALYFGREIDITRSGARKYTPDAVSLMTLHGAKGLEFPVVFLCGLNKGILPLQNGGAPADIAEERRLFYVGMTRARERLYLLSSEEQSQQSPFLCAIPPYCLAAKSGDERPAARQLRFF